MPTSTTKVTLLESDYKESVLLGPFLIRNWDTTKYVNGDGTTPALTAAGDGKLNVSGCIFSHCSYRSNYFCSDLGVRPNPQWL